MSTSDAREGKAGCAERRADRTPRRAPVVSRERRSTRVRPGPANLTGESRPRYIRAEVLPKRPDLPVRWKVARGWSAASLCTTDCQASREGAWAAVEPEGRIQICGPEPITRERADNLVPRRGGRCESDTRICSVGDRQEIHCAAHRGVPHLHPAVADSPSRRRRARKSEDQVISGPKIRTQRGVDDGSPNHGYRIERGIGREQRPVSGPAP